jgi:hypothetical protein
LCTSVIPCALLISLAILQEISLANSLILIE